MADGVVRVALLGSTGSIGRSTLEVIAASGGKLQAVALSARNSTKLLEEQARQFRPHWVVVTNPTAAAAHDWSGLPAETTLRVGLEANAQVAAEAEVDVVVSAIVGRAGLEGTWSALAAGKRVALANKESLVVAGPLITRLAKENHATLLPVDSEHSAIFQALQAGRREEVKRVVLDGQRRALPHV